MHISMKDAVRLGMVSTEAEIEATRAKIAAQEAADEAKSKEELIAELNDLRWAMRYALAELRENGWRGGGKIALERVEERFAKSGIR